MAGKSRMFWKVRAMPSWVILWRFRPSSDFPRKRMSPSVAR